MKITQPDWAECAKEKIQGVFQTVHVLRRHGMTRALSQLILNRRGDERTPVDIHDSFLLLGAKDF